MKGPIIKNVHLHSRRQTHTHMHTYICTLSVGTTKLQRNKGVACHISLSSTLQKRSFVECRLQRAATYRNNETAAASVMSSSPPGASVCRASIWDYHIHGKADAGSR